MEYERALFRVYDRSMEGARAPYVRNACHLAQQSLLIVSAGLLVCLVLLHRDFVNKPGKTHRVNVYAGCTVVLLLLLLVSIYR